MIIQASAAKAAAPDIRTGTTPPRRKIISWVRQGGLTTVLLAIPVIVAFLYFSWGPVVAGIVMSWQRTNLIDPVEWVGFENFVYVLQDPLLPQAALNTLYFAALVVIVGFPLPLLLAVAMAELRRRKGLFSVLVYLPVIVPPVVAILLWKAMYNPSETGVFNTILGWFGVSAQPWLNSPAMAMPSIAIESIWAHTGTTVIIYLAALLSVRPELYEAAELDGANIFRRVWHITLPQIRGIILVLLLLHLIGSLQVFTEPYLFTGGGPQNATVTVMMLIYRYAFTYGDYGAATALSALLAVALGVLSLVYFAATRKWGSE